jgi:AraC-like DNA-binding protein
MHHSTFPTLFLHFSVFLNFSTAMLSEKKFFNNVFQGVAGYATGNPLLEPPLVVKQDVIPNDHDEQLDRVNRHEDFFAVYVVQRGQGTHVIDGVPYAIARGDVYVMGLDTTHYYTRCRNLVVQNFFFLPALFDAATRDALAEVPGMSSLIPGFLGESGGTSRAGRWLHLPPAAYDRMEEQMAELRAEWQGSRPGHVLLLRGLFTRLLIHLARLQAAAHPRQVHVQATTHGAAVTEAIQYMEERYAEPLRIAQVAETVYMSPDRFTKIFFQAAGQTPRAYLRYLRVERAKALLADTDLGMAEIGEQSGFAESAYFTRAFRAATGMTPSEFRRRSQG